MRKIDAYSMMIVGKYLMTSDDYRRVILVNSKFRDLLDKYKYNPHRDLKLFHNIETQVLYSKVDKIKEGMYRYIIAYDINYKQYLEFPELIRNKMEFRNLKLTEMNVLEYSTLINYIGTLGTQLKTIHDQVTPFSMKTYIIPDKINSIEINTFNSSELLRKVVFPSSLTSIGNYAFKKCPQLTTVDLPKNLLVIGNEAFSKSIQKITIPNKVKRIGARCFEGCLLKRFELPISVYELGRGCFEYNTRLTEVILSPYIRSIPPNCFLECISLQNIVIPEGITSIENKAFFHCGLKSLVLPFSITSIAFDAFDSSSITKLVQRNNKKIQYPVSLFEAILFDNSSTQCNNIHYTKQDINFIENDLFNKVSVIEEQSFINSGISSINLPPSLKEIKQFAFYNCSKLTSVSIPTSVTLIETYAFVKTPILNLKIPLHLKESLSEFDPSTCEFANIFLIN
ncbi:hypothetical protein ENUP19_0274G0076 [Entamoeba nuttalli]|uniref:Leucine rich repeat protein, BspA family protein n=2 Tax=Entamoeba nuttalli TaxID=412467 RepID=K2GVW2_ENTNP|nr:leucine rich repeat protein, BspA family protein [Entamoeba nuttalli P19]EKE37967.1 leucine rich repeat protein, BspA family protein [Entamoeba nuttalli P19]|eukprot:XP_008859696.1 leucine rich repeat protein, BspA family protein [Entamoeba nuttalli P19]